jgi:hypothetical protein
MCRAAALSVCVCVCVCLGKGEGSAVTVLERLLNKGIEGTSWIIEEKREKGREGGRTKMETLPLVLFTCTCTCTTVTVVVHACHCVI